jgi:DNA replication and repair protein RecF
MQVDWLSLTDFRSYETLEWSPDPGVNLLLGPNGAGKTNLLEAIAFLATLRSFRSVEEGALIKDGADAAIVRAGISTEERARLMEIELNRVGPRRAQVDKSRLRRTSDLLGVVRVIAFLPEDLDLVKRGPAYRRDLIDQVALQLWPAAHLDQAEFDRALRQRNAFLRAGERDEATLSVWDSRFAQSGGRVMGRRVAVMETLAPWLEDTYTSISQRDDRASLGYVCSWTAKEISTGSSGDFAADITAALERSRKADYDRRLTTTGPHRDEPVFRIDGVDTRTHGSQGEQRTMALAVKLAAHRAVADVVGEQPVLLLDDVFSELDPVRAKALAGAIPDQAQTLITSARPEDVPVPGSLWRVGEGVQR